MSWLYLILAGVLEIIWAFSMKQSDGFSRPIPTLITLVAMLGSFWLLSLALRTIPLSIAYPLWTGMGAVGAFLIGVVWLGEGVSAVKLLALLLLISGLVLMKLSA